MITIFGKYTNALVYTTDNEQYAIDDYARKQLQMICDHPSAAGSRIRVMPDVHPGKVGTIGLTMTVGESLMPNLVGVDIGCGMTIARIRTKGMECQKLDTVIRDNVPVGGAVRKTNHRLCDKAVLRRLHCYKAVDEAKAERSIGTLGGGNHFIEVDMAQDGTKYLVIHSGSRNLGKQVADIYQHLAVELHSGKEEYFKQREALITAYKEAGRRNEIQAALKDLKWERRDCLIPEDLCYLYGTYLEDYLHDVEICQQFARRNREKMAEVILERTGMTGSDAFHTIHNYIDTEEMILRKGAIAAHEGEKVLIPINMRDGSVLAVGRGNPEWNYSAPHGAGRLMSRTRAKENLSLDDYRKTMEGIYTTCVNAATLDEAPMAYKSLADIIDVIRESVDVIDIMKPIYNFKASD